MDTQPRENPKMVAFDEVVDLSSFSKRPGYTKRPLLHKLGVAFAVLGILAAIGLAMLKHKELAEPNSGTGGSANSLLEDEFDAAKERLNEFRDGPSLADKMAYVRIPSTNLPTYPSLRERMNAFYTTNGLTPHFPSLIRSTTSMVERNGIEFLKIEMTNKRVPSNLYFEKSVGGYALDWDSFVGYNPIDWTNFLTNIDGNSTAGVFRLIVTPEDHYSGRFQDKGRYLCYEVTDLAGISSAIAYVERDSPAGETIAAKFDDLTSRDEQRIYIVAELKWDERVEGNYLTQIDKVLADSWLVP